MATDPDPHPVKITVPLKGTPEELAATAAAQLAEQQKHEGTFTPIQFPGPSKLAETPAPLPTPAEAADALAQQGTYQRAVQTTEGVLVPRDLGKVT